MSGAQLVFGAGAGAVIVLAAVSVTIGLRLARERRLAGLSLVGAGAVWFAAEGLRLLQLEVIHPALAGPDNETLRLLVDLVGDNLYFGLGGIGVLLLFFAAVVDRGSRGDGRREPMALARQVGQQAWRYYRARGQRERNRGMGEGMGAEVDGSEVNGGTPKAAGVSDRRRQLLDRLADVIAEDGIEGVSIRTLAGRAGVSIGTVQYYFATKSELLQRVWEYVSDEVERRFDPGAMARMPRRQLLSRLVDLLVAPGPDDRLARVWLALAARAAHDEEIARLHRRQWRHMEGLIARVLVAANPARVNESDDAAAELLGLCDGLTISVLTEPDRMPTARARRIAHAWTDRWSA